MTLSEAELPIPLPQWPGEYRGHLSQRLDRSAAYIKTSPRPIVHQHVRSFFTLLSEARRYPELTPKMLELIAALHPLPVRWGLGFIWEQELRFALEHLPRASVAQRCEYLCSLADVYLFSGQFERAIANTEAVLALEDAPAELVARASRILFTSLRSTGPLQPAEELIEHLRPVLMADQPAASVPPHLIEAWLRFNQSELELMRERGQHEQALRLAEDMLWLDECQGSPDGSLTADLLTHRSTLLWAQGYYSEAAADLQRAVRLYQDQEDQFNAESLQSNLGLVYWTMGDLDSAEKSLQASIGYYRKTGSDQLITFDIGNLGLVYFARGELDQALKLTREHIEHAQKLSFISEYNRGLRNLGTILYYYGEYQEAVRVLTTCHSYYEKRGSRPAYWLDVVWLGLCRGALGEHEKGLGMVREVLQRSREMGSQVLEQVTLRSLAYFSPPGARPEILCRSLELAFATDRKLEQAAVYLMLAGTPGGEPQDWLAGCDLLRQIGAEKWLVGYSIENPPFIPLLI